VEEVLSSSKAKLVEQPKIADLYEKCSQLAAKEEKEMGRVMGTVFTILEWINEPVALRPKSLGGAFSRFRSVSLRADATVVTTDFEGKVTSKPLKEFRLGESLAILREAYPELQSLVAGKRGGAQVKPLLSMKALMGGARLLGGRSYRVLVANSGGDCVDLEVSVRLPGGQRKISRPFDLKRGQEVEVDLGVFKEGVGSGERLEIGIDCKDTLGHELQGDQTVPFDEPSWQEAALSGKKPA
jgi:hypothetical protein